MYQVTIPRRQLVTTPARIKRKSGMQSHFAASLEDSLRRNTDGHGVDFLMARAVDGNGKVWLKSTALTRLQHLENHSAMYIATAQQVLRLAPKDASTAKVDETTRRVSILINGLQLSMPEQTRNDT